MIVYKKRPKSDYFYRPHFPEVVSDVFFGDAWMNFPLATMSTPRDSKASTRSTTLHSGQAILMYGDKGVFL